GTWPQGCAEGGAAARIDPGGDGTARGPGPRRAIGHAHQRTAEDGARVAGGNGHGDGLAVTKLHVVADDGTVDDHKLRRAGGWVAALGWHSEVGPGTLAEHEGAGHQVLAEDDVDVLEEGRGRRARGCR